jgi:hypothetical protein
MKFRGLFGFAAVASIALLLGQGDAGAQAQPAQPPPVPSNLPAAAQTLTPAQMVTQADSILARLNASRANIRRQLEAARAQRDVVKTLCLNDKLNQMDVAVRSADERKQALALSAGRGDGELASHEFTILSVLRQRGDQLTAEANQCIGREAEFIGESAVTSEVDPNLPGEDPSQFPPVLVDVVAEIPPCSSCFK